MNPKSLPLYYLFLVMVLTLACNTDNAAITEVPKSDVNAKKALSLLVACIQTYRDFAGKSVVPPQGWSFAGDRFRGDDFFFTMKKDLQFGLIFRNEENPDHILIAFRGTVTTMEWWDDAQASPTDFLYYNQERGGPSLKVEVGFFSIYRSIRDQLFSFIETHNPNQITITGHSLGSALATLFLYELRLLYPQRPTSSYNYASPRVGGPNFVQALSLQSQPPTSPSTEALIRFRNLSDVVPDVPFTWESYEHSPWQFSLNFKEKEGLLPDYALRHSADNYFLALRKIFALPDYEATLFNEKQDDFILLKE